MSGQAWQGLIQKRIAQHFQRFQPHISEGVRRRSFLQSTVGATGLALTSGLWTPQRASGQPGTMEPKPIPGGATPLGILAHHFPLPSTPVPLSEINDPSEITDFNGVIGDSRLLPRRLNLSLNSRIGISTREVSVVRLGMVLGTISAAEIAIPVSTARKRVSLRLKDTTIDYVLAQSGLMVLGNRS